LKTNIDPYSFSLKDVDDKEFIASRSYFLRCREEFNNVYVSADTTKYQIAKQKQLVEMQKSCK